MPRTGRVVLPEYPHHVVQRGHNRQVVFRTRYDFQQYLSDLRELKEKFDIRVYAYCLMSNHVHLLLAPFGSASGMGRLMKALAARATRRRNRREERTGTLWEGRYKSSLVQADRYLLACCRYIELNSVRAGIVRRPVDYPWSSFRQRTGVGDGLWIDRDPAYLGLADEEPQRRARYQSLVHEAIPDGEQRLIREALQRGQLTGNDGFVTEIEQLTGQRIKHRGRGRPARSDLVK